MDVWEFSLLLVSVEYCSLTGISQFGEFLIAIKVLNDSQVTLSIRLI